MICYKKNGKHRSCVYIELMHLRDLLSTQEAREAYDSYTSFMLSNLIVHPELNARCTLPFLNHSIQGLFCSPQPHAVWACLLSSTKANLQIVRLIPYKNACSASFFRGRKPSR